MYLSPVDSGEGVGKANSVFGHSGAARTHGRSAGGVTVQQWRRGRTPFHLHNSSSDCGWGRNRGCLFGCETATAGTLHSDLEGGDRGGDGMLSPRADGR